IIIHIAGMGFGRLSSRAGNPLQGVSYTLLAVQKIKIKILRIKDKKMINITSVWELLNY
ncbi:hypothetical protein L9F63_010280, partial [Diploptera punctata]